MSDNVPVNALETSLAIVEALGEQGALGLTDLARAVDLPKSTVFNHVKTLEQNEYVVSEEGTYRVGCRYLELGAKARDYHDVYEAAREEVDRLATETGELSALLVEEHGRGVFLHREEGNQSVHIDSYVGQRIHLHGAGLGKAILSALPRDRVVDIVDRHGLPELTENTITDRDELFVELDAIAERGVAFDDQERLNGLRSVAVPLTDQDGAVLGSMSIAGPTSRVQDDRFREEFPDKISEAADVIELNVTYS
ncbi:MAG: IclR family transcriptional regulator [Halovenus sp.]